MAKDRLASGNIVVGDVVDFSKKDGAKGRGRVTRISRWFNAVVVFDVETVVLPTEGDEIWPATCECMEWGNGEYAGKCAECGSAGIILFGDHQGMPCAKCKGTAVCTVCKGEADEWPASIRDRELPG